MNQYWPILQPNIDSFGLITQSAQQNFDGGDTMERCGLFLCSMYYLHKMNKLSDADWQYTCARYQSILVKIQKEDAWSFARHPDPSKWYSADDVMSRDQLTPNIIAMGYCESPWLFKTFVWHISRALLFTTNTRENGAIPTDGYLPWYKAILYSVGLYSPSNPTYSWKLPDITDPSIWGAYIRAFKAWPLYPFLLLSDWILVINSMITYCQLKSNPSQSVDPSQMMLLLQSQDTFSTWIAKLARKIYTKVPVCSPPSWKTTSDQFPPQSMFEYYFDPALCEPRFDIIYKEILPLLNN